MKKNDILTPIGLVLAIGFIFFAIAQGKGGVGTVSYTHLILILMKLLK